MKTLIYDILLIIINLYKTFKKYDFVLSCITDTPYRFMGIITDNIIDLSDIAKLSL